MSRTSSKIITGLASALLVAAVVAPSASASARTATELGQSTDPSASVAASDGPSQRTATELGQSTDPSAPVAASDGPSQRTATELGQSTHLSPSPTPGSDSSGLDWDDVAFAGGGVLALVLIAIGAVALVTRRRDTVRKAQARAVSS